MAVLQNSLFDILEYCENGKKPRNKRVRYKTPTYIKSYQFRVFNEDTGQFQYYGDEKHILRIKTLHKLYSLIYGYCNVNVFEQFERKELVLGKPVSEDRMVLEPCPPNFQPSIIVWGEDKQAEIADTWNLPLKNRVLLHLRLLRGLRKGLSVEEALNELQN